VVDHRPGRTCELVIQTTKGHTSVVFGPKDKEDPRDCRADFRVRLPPGVDFEVAVGQGRLEARGLSVALSGSVGQGPVLLAGVSGPTELSLGQGDFELTDVVGPVVLEVGQGRILGTATGPLTATVGQGRVKLSGLTSDARVDTGVGDILLGFDAAPSEVTLNAGNGHVVVDLPTGTTVQPNLSAFSGGATCELPEGPGVQVTAVSGIGSVRVH